ncbi:MAG: PilZ domain-containing protein [Methylococcales bacterium]|nr:PilZ domain-containing protein [Methylococcales bacterium]
MNHPSERRRFFRIDDAIHLAYRKVSAEAVAPVESGQDALLNHCSLISALDVIAQEARPLLLRMQKDVPEIAQYLKMLDAKIDLVAQAVMMREPDLEKTENRNVNLSATGLAFNCEEALPPDSYVELKVLLLSCMAVIVIYAKVVYCQPDNKAGAEGGFRVGVDYVNIAEQDRELLIRHVVKHQLQQIRETKEAASI